MPYETYYEYDSNINLDSQSLYDYVQYSDQLNNLMSTNGPDNIDTFSNGVERFKENSKDDKDDNNDNDIKDNKPFGGNFIIYLLLGALFLLFAYFLLTGKLKCGGESNVLEQDTLNPLSEDVGVGALRAVFVK